jgi:hypothetical protein
VATLLEGAPEWPQDSAFALLHRDLTMVIATPMPARRVA